MFKSAFSVFAQKLSLKFFLITGAAVTIIFVSIFLWFAHHQERLIREQLEKQAVILHKQIVLTRQWVSNKSPVLVREQEEERVQNAADSEEIVDTHGTKYVKIPPSVLTKQLSELASRDGLYSFRIANSTQLNPENAPDDFEAEALEQFRDGRTKELFRTEKVRGQTVLRYAAPLYVNESCQKCHAQQGYSSGDVGGCLSVFIPMDKAIDSAARNQAILLAVGGLMGAALLALLFFSSRFLVFKRIAEIRKAMSNMTTCEIGDIQRRGGDELKEISDLCTTLNEKMQNYHHDLEQKIAEATKDLTETNKRLKAANKELQRLNKAKSEFFSSISHELRTPLTSIKGAADLMYRKGGACEPLYLDIIKRNTEHLMKSVLDFLDYSRIEAGQFDLKIKEGSLNDVVKDAICSQQVEAAARSLILRAEAKQEVRFPFDHERIYQVLTNILSNAVRFSPDGGEILVATQVTDGCVSVSISDQGPGIDPRYHEAIFQKFFQIPEDGDAPLHKGSAGIGLAICKGIVEAHGGRIWVESSPGAGSTFVFSIPIGDPHERRSHTSG